MYFSTALAAAASLALAQAITIPVSVGFGGLLKFSPSDITASVGDHVEFTFFATNHSVTQSSFADPCHPLAGGLFSTFQPTANISSKVFVVTVTDTSPIWLYCGQGNHCQKGMVAAINAPATGNTLDAFTLLAGNASSSTSPSSKSPVGGVLEFPPTEVTVTQLVTATITATESSFGEEFQTTYLSTFPITYTTDAVKPISTISRGTGSAPTVLGGGDGGGSSVGSAPSATSSAKGSDATAVGVNGAMVGAAVLGALALL
ncbi:Cupredoxin [Stipitochalara longipes BDJ]|nr:Cupredoxin [Stipitochalara longipes BDJ]